MYGEAARSPELDTSELAAYATVASLMMNTDAFVNKE